MNLPEGKARLGKKGHFTNQKRGDDFVIEGGPGEHISRFAAHLSRVAMQMHGKIGGKVIGKFNGIELVATVNTTAEDLEKAYAEASQKAAEEYKKTPGYKKLRRKQAEDLKRANAKAVVLMARLEQMNWASLGSILDWITDARDTIDMGGVDMDKQKIIQTFLMHGFKAKENCGDDFKDRDAENVARYIIGQVIDMLGYAGSFHPIILSFIEKWHAQFDGVPAGELCPLH